MKNNSSDSLNYSGLKQTKFIMENVYIKLGILYFILVAIHIFFLKDMKVPIVFADEFGFLANAAFLAGYDWSSIVSAIPYYSNGYSIILLPIFMFFKDPIIIYKAILILNSFFVSGIVFIAYYIAGKLFHHCDKHVKLISAFVICLYPTYLAYANTALSESFLSFIFWACVLCYYKIGENAKGNSIFIILGVLLAYLYMIHNRAIGAMIVGILVIIYAKFVNKINSKQLLLFFCGFIPILFIQISLKKFLVSNLWLSSNTSNNNNFGLIPRLIQNLSTFDGIENFLQTFFGQLYYLGISSYFLFYVGILVSINISLVYVRNYQKKTKDITINDNICTYIDASVISKYYIGFFFLLLSVIASFLVSVLFLTKGPVGDHMIYGRYNEAFTGPVIYIGLLFVLDKIKLIKKTSYLYIITPFLFFVVVLSLWIQHILDKRDFNFISLTGLYIYRTEAGKVELLFPAIIVILISLFLYVVLRSGIKYNAFISLLIISTLFLYTSHQYVKYILVDTSLRYLDKYNNVTNIIKENISREPIYFINTGLIPSGSCISALYSQYLLPDRKITFINNDHSKEYSKVDNSFVITNTLDFQISKLLGLKLLKMNVVFGDDSWDSYLWVTPGNIQEKLLNKQVEFLSQHDGSIAIPLETFYTQNSTKSISDEQYLQSNGNAGFLIYGPYIHLRPDEYQIAFELELLETDKKDLGFIDIVDGTNTIYKLNIDKDMFQDNKFTTKHNFILTKGARKLEMRVYSHKGVVLRIDKVSISTTDTNEYNWLPKDNFSTINGKLTDKGTLISNGNEGFLLYGPYMKLENGEYKLKIRGSLVEPTKDSLLGYVDIVHSKATQQIVRVPIKLDEIEKGDIVKELLFSLGSPVQDLEFRIYVNKGVYMEIERVVLEKASNK